MHTSLRKSQSTICSGLATVEPYQPEIPGFIERLSSQEDRAGNLISPVPLRLMDIAHEVS
jgi:hypothetical protein